MDKAGQVILRLTAQAKMLSDQGKEVWHKAKEEAISPLLHGAHNCENTLKMVNKF